MNTMITAVPRATNPVETTNFPIPKKPQVNESPWATVAWKAARLPNPQVAPIQTYPRTRIKQADTLPQKEDKRLFLRLEKEHEWRKISPVTIKKIITDRAGVATSSIVATHQIRSGLAFECASDALRETILRTAPPFKKENIIIEPA